MKRLFEVDFNFIRTGVVGSAIANSKRHNNHNHSTESLQSNGIHAASSYAATISR